MSMEGKSDGTAPAPGPLSGLRVLDMSRVLAGPSATQILGDLGADVVKIERPGRGDDTRGWGPPFLPDAQGRPAGPSAYYLSANRNKRSLALDFSTERGQRVARDLAARADILVENYRVGTLARYGLDWKSLRADNPGLIYCSLTGFGQTGPLAGHAGYDVMIQALGGIMSLTGPPEGEPMKVGVAIADLMAGMYATTAILAALHHRARTGTGQYIDQALLDAQIAWLSNAGQYHLTEGRPPPRMGNAHPMIVPYQVFETRDGHLVLAVGNDDQFARFCALAGRADLAVDPRFATNAGRVAHRETLVPEIAAILGAGARDSWIAALEAESIPCAPIQDLGEVFAHPQTRAREMTVQMAHPQTPEPVSMIASPMRLSDSPVSYRRAPPGLGADSREVLAEWLGLGATEIADLDAAGVIEATPAGEKPRAADG